MFGNQLSASWEDEAEEGVDNIFWRVRAHQKSRLRLVFYDGHYSGMSGTVLWSKEDDIKLWALRTKPTSQVSMCLRSILAFCSSSERGFNFTQDYFSCSFIQLKLAVTFGRNNGGIRSRLKHLQNPEHKAYIRMHGGGGGEGGYAATTAVASALGRLTTSSYASSDMSATGTAAKPKS